jgi:hypothetical protein
VARSSSAARRRAQNKLVVVRRRPFFDPESSPPRWRLVPVDTVHTAVLVDRDGGPPVAVTEDKGFLRHDEAWDKHPASIQSFIDMCDRVKANHEAAGGSWQQADPWCVLREDAVKALEAHKKGAKDAVAA